jgi:hypothetical protein
LLSLADQMLLASLLCLIAMRNEFGAFPLMVAVPNDDRDWLRTHLFPPWPWQIWVGRYQGPADQHWAYHLPIHIESLPSFSRAAVPLTGQVAGSDNVSPRARFPPRDTSP